MHQKKIMIAFAGFWMIIAGIVAALINSVIDWIILKTRYITSKTSRILIRGVVFGGVSLIQHYKIPSPEIYLLFVLGIMLQASVFWICFDLLLNAMRGLKALYLGTVGSLDTTFKDLPVFQILAKVFLLGVSCLCYFSMVSFL